MTEKVLILGATHHHDRRAGDKRGFAIGFVPSWLAAVLNGKLWFVVDAIGRVRLAEKRDTYLWKRPRLTSTKAVPGMSSAEQTASTHDLP